MRRDDDRDRARRPVLTSAVAIAIRALALLIICELAGFAAVGHQLRHMRVAWIPVVAAAELLTYPAYLVAYRSVVALSPSGRPRAVTMMRVVVAGFGPFSPAGGFALDLDALRLLDGDPAVARSNVAAMAALEWAVLAPIAWLIAIVLLASDSPIAGSLLWPWVIGVPVGLGSAVAVMASPTGRALLRRAGDRIAVASRVQDALGAVSTMARHPRRHAGAWLGMASYWVAEMVAFDAAARCAGLALGIGGATLAYATGYLLSRRSLPLGGAGLIEALLVFSLFELHQPLAASLVAVLVYRVFNFGVVVIPSLVAFRGLRNGVAPL